MQLIRAVPELADGIYRVIQATIDGVYPKYYLPEAVQFFRDLHNAEHIREGILRGETYAAVDGGSVLGTGTVCGDHISAVYVLPEQQGRGVGTCIMDLLEAQVAAKHAAAVLEGSLPAVRWYEHRGYRTQHHDVHPLDDGVKLVYDVMVKDLSPLR